MMEKPTTEDIRSWGLHNSQYIWIEKNIGRKWAYLISSIESGEKQWELWDEFRQSKLAKVWDEAIEKELNNG